MSGSLIGIGIEIVVAILLLVTIFYCVNLNRKLQRLRSDETDMKAMVGELIEATEHAEGAIKTLKASAADWDQALGKRILKAEKLAGQLEALTAEMETRSGELGEINAASENVLDRLKQICAAARPAAVSERESAAQLADALDAQLQAASFFRGDTRAEARPAKAAVALGKRPVPKQIGPRQRPSITPERDDRTATGRAA